MGKKVFRSLTVLCLAIGLLFALAIAANASDLTPDYYISGGPGAYSVGASEGESEIGTDCATFADALSACRSIWGGSGTPVIQLGTADTPLSVNRGDGKLISATYTGAVNIEHASSIYGLQVNGATVELRDFTLTNSLAGIGGEYNAVYVYLSSELTIGPGTKIIVEDGGAYDANPNALYNDGAVTINDDALLSIENKGRVITNCGTCNIGGNEADDIVISSSPLSGTGILNFTGGILTIGEGTVVKAYYGLQNYNTATISGGILESPNTTINNYAQGTLYISGGEIKNTGTTSSYNALLNNGTAVISGGVITSDGTDCAIWTMYKLTFEGNCQVSAPNGTAVGSNTNTKAGSEINIRGNASITGKTTGVEASAATGTGGKGTSTLTISGGSVFGNSYAVKTSADTEISGGVLTAVAVTDIQIQALYCSDGATVNITDGEFKASGKYAYGIYNKGATVNYSGGSVVAACTTSGAVRVYGLYNNNATANITGGTISGEGSDNTASAIFDTASPLGKGISISNEPTLKSVSPYTIRLEKRATDSGALTYFGTLFYANANAAVAIQGVQDGDTYLIDSSSYTGAQAHALPDTGYGSPRWTSDAARIDILSAASPAALLALTAGANTLVYLEVKPVFTITVNSGANGTASASVSSAVAGDTVMLTATPNEGYRFKEWQVISGGVTITDNQFIMPSSNVTVKAIFEQKVYMATVNVLCNERSIDAPGTVQLKQGGSTYIAASAETGVYTAAAPNGTYAVWINNEDTGKTISISDDTADVTVDYYSVIFSITNSGAAVGGSITATANGTSIVKNDCVLAGKTIVLTVNPSGAQTYTYKWTGNGAREQTTQSITFTLTEYVNAVCKVTGSATYAVTLNTNGGAINGGNVTSYDYGAGATLPTDVTRDGFVFGGWYNNAGFTGSPVTTIGSTEKNAKAFWAKWTAKTAIEYTPAVQSHTYGTTDASYTVNCLSLTDFTVKYYVGSTWTTIAPIDAGSYDVCITRSEDTTYASYDSGILTNQFVITPAVLTVAIKPELTIIKVYDEDASVDGVQSDWLMVNGLKNGETATASGTWSYDSADAGTGKTVNITDISIGHGTAKSANYSYTLDALSTTGTITNAAQAVTAAEIDYMAETISTAAIMQYSADNSIWSDCTANMDIDPSWFGDAVYFRYAKKPNYDASATQALSIPARPAAPSAAGTNETSCGQDNGSISGLSAAMEYKIDTGSWTDATETELTGLAAGIYAIRVKAVAGNNFKSPEQEIILQNGPMLTVNFDGQGGTADSITNLSYNALMSAPSPNPTRTGYAFAGWYKEAACTNAWDFKTDKVTANITLYAKWAANNIDDDHTMSANDYTPPARTITVTETSSELFTGCAGEIQAEANMQNAFANSVEVKVTDMQEDKTNFGFAAGVEVYSFDISLYIKGTNEKTEPAAGYAVTISLPVPPKMFDKKELLSVVHRSADGVVTTLSSRLTQLNGVWYLVFNAADFSPYALVVRSVKTDDNSAGIPYYLDGKGSKVFIGFAANGRYIAPEGVSVSTTRNNKDFTDVSGHWAAQYIAFVTEREIFLGTGDNTFSPNTGMTRAMFATVVGRLYERSYGEIIAPNAHAFTDCDYSNYYGKYVDWAAKNDIIGGYGNMVFGPDDSIAREQMAAILYRFANFLRVLPNDMDAALYYPDAGSISSYAKNAALYCQTTGVIGGRIGGGFASQETATRSEVATIIKRFVESVVE